MCEDLKIAVESSLWVEKYKPTMIDDVLVEDHLKVKFKEYIDQKEIPCLLFAGSSGNGKTTCAKIIAHSISEDVMFINASSESGVDVVRHKIEPFCVTQSFGNTKKVVILDEMEMSSENFQTALREVIEKFYTTTRFILTCNFLNKVIEPLKSRTQEYKFGNINQIDILKRCMSILKAENVKYDKKNLAKIVKNYNTDIRRIINTVQKLTYKENEELVLAQFTTLEEQQLVVLDLVKTKQLSKFRKFIGEQNINPDELTKFLFNKAFDKQLSENNWVEIVAEIAEMAYRLKVGTDPEITITNGVLQIMNLI